MLDYGPSQSWGHASACTTSCLRISKITSFENIEVLFFCFFMLAVLFSCNAFFAFHAVTCLFLMLLNFDDIFAGCQAAVLGRGSHFSSVGYSALNNPQSILKIAISCLQQFSLKPCPAWHKFHVHFQWIQRHQMYCQWTNQCSLMQCKYPNPQIWKRNSKYQQKDKSDCFTKADEAPAEFSQNASSELADSEFSLVFVRSPFLIMWWCNCIWFWVFVDFFSEGVLMLSTETYLHTFVPCQGWCHQCQCWYIILTSPLFEHLHDFFWWWWPEGGMIIQIW